MVQPKPKQKKPEQDAVVTDDAGKQVKSVKDVAGKKKPVARKSSQVKRLGVGKAGVKRAAEEEHPPMDKLFTGDAARWDRNHIKACMNALLLDPTEDVQTKDDSEKEANPAKRVAADTAAYAKMTVARPMERFISKEPRKEGGEFISTPNVQRAIGIMCAEMTSIDANMDMLSKEDAEAMESLAEIGIGTMTGRTADDIQFRKTVNLQFSAVQREGSLLATLHYEELKGGPGQDHRAGASCAAVYDQVRGEAGAQWGVPESLRYMMADGNGSGFVRVPRSLLAELAKMSRMTVDLSDREKVAAAIWSGLEIDELPPFVGQVKRCEELMISRTIACKRLMEMMPVAVREFVKKYPDTTFAEIPLWLWRAPEAPALDASDDAGEPGEGGEEEAEEAGYEDDVTYDDEGAEEVFKQDDVPTDPVNQEDEDLDEDDIKDLLEEMKDDKKRELVTVPTVDVFVLGEAAPAEAGTKKE